MRACLTQTGLRQIDVSRCVLLGETGSGGLKDAVHNAEADTIRSQAIGTGTFSDKAGPDLVFVIAASRPSYAVEAIVCAAAKSNYTIAAVSCVIREVEFADTEKTLTVGCDLVRFIEIVFRADQVIIFMDI